MVLEYGNHTLVAYLGWIGAMLLIGMVLRAKVPFLRNWLVPSCLTGGIIGFALINTGVIQVDVALFSTIAGQLFTLSFIAIGLTQADEDKSKSAGEQTKEMARGGLGIGMTWCIIFMVQLLLGAGFFKVWSMVTGSSVSPIYGMMLPRGYAQGPGQAVANGKIFESFGWENAAMIGLTFAAFGFLFAFLFGVPLAKYGMKHKLTRSEEDISKDVLYGFFARGVDMPTSGKQTTHSGNIDSMAFHVALICACYMVTYHLTYFVAGHLSQTLSNVVIGLLFMWGMFVGYGVKFILNKLGLMYLLDNTTMKRLTGFATDFMVVAAFMGISLKVLGAWFAPIVILCTVAAVVTFVICVFFGQRFGAKYDFERTLGLYGMATGTAASGIALCRIVDPELKTPTTVEVGLSNAFMNITMILLPVGIGIISGQLSAIWFGVYALMIIPLWIIMKVFGAYGKRTYTLRNKCDPPGNCDV